MVLCQKQQRRAVGHAGRCNVSNAQGFAPGRGARVQAFGLVHARRSKRYQRVVFADFETGFLRTQAEKNWGHWGQSDSKAFGNVRPFVVRCKIAAVRAQKKAQHAAGLLGVFCGLDQSPAAAASNLSSSGYSGQPLIAWSCQSHAASSVCSFISGYSGQPCQRIPN